METIQECTRLYDSIMEQKAGCLQALKDSVSVLDRTKEQIVASALCKENLTSAPNQLVQQLIYDKRLLQKVTSEILSVPYSEIADVTTEVLQGKPLSGYSHAILRLLDPKGKIFPGPSEPRRESIPESRQPFTPAKRLSLSPEMMRRSWDPIAHLMQPAKGAGNRKVYYNAKEIVLVDSDGKPKRNVGESSDARIKHLRFEVEQRSRRERELASARPGLSQRKYSNVLIKMATERTETKETVDCSQAFKTFVKYYSSELAGGRKSAAGPLIYIAQSHIKQKGEADSMDRLKHMKVFKRERRSPITMYFRRKTVVESPRKSTVMQETGRSRNAGCGQGSRSVISAMSPTSPGGKSAVSSKRSFELDGLMKSCDEYEENSHRSMASVRSESAGLKKRYVSLKRQLINTREGFDESAIRDEIKNNIENFHVAKRCFIYGAKGQGRFLFVDPRGGIHDIVKESDNIMRTPQGRNGLRSITTRRYRHENI